MLKKLILYCLNIGKQIFNFCQLINFKREAISTQQEKKDVLAGATAFLSGLGEAVWFAKCTAAKTL